MRGHADRIPHVGVTRAIAADVLRGQPIRQVAGVASSALRQLGRAGRGLRERGPQTELVTERDAGGVEGGGDIGGDGADELLDVGGRVDLGGHSGHLRSG